MRLFAALDLDDELRARLADVSSVFASLPGVRWTRPEALHLTLRFFGEWPEDRLPELTAALAQVGRPDRPFEIRLERLAFLPSEHSPRVFVAVGPTPALLAEFQQRIEQVARELGFEPERRAFLSHVTLARLRDPRQGKKLFEAARVTPVELGACQPEHWALYQSALTPAGARYTKLAQWRLFPS
ncbi:MAG: RNA 2',3'-cyclic phosphodiesterase [Bryobacterales bacterium]|nr:RNA 2',3'-cyclic phosphodiesterase [Bryobacterales bacterium]